MNFPRVICGFPGVGKSTLFANKGNQKIVDSDSSTFDKADFPANYIAHIKQKLADGYTVLCSTHKDVRAALVAEGIDFILVYPLLECKDEYLRRYVKRGSPASFVFMMDSKWEEFVNDCASQESCTHVRLGHDQYMPSFEFLAEYS